MRCCRSLADVGRLSFARSKGPQHPPIDQLGQHTLTQINIWLGVVPVAHGHRGFRTITPHQSALVALQCAQATDTYNHIAYFVSPSHCRPPSLSHTSSSRPPFTIRHRQRTVALKTCCCYGSRQTLTIVGQCLVSHEKSAFLASYQTQNIVRW